MVTAGESKLTFRKEWVALCFWYCWSYAIKRYIVISLNRFIYYDIQSRNNIEFFYIILFILYYIYIMYLFYYIRII